MTDPLEGLTDAHLQAALDEFDYLATPDEVRRGLSGSYAAHHIIAHARQIAANEKLAAELAELRAKYEPEPVDPVVIAARELVAARPGNNKSYASRILRGEEDGLGAIQNAMLAIRRGMEMQIDLGWADRFGGWPSSPSAWEPAQFTREEADRIAGHWIGHYTMHGALCKALTTPHAELRAMLGDG